MKVLRIVLIFVMVMGMVRVIPAASHSEKAIPDYSETARADVPEPFKWRIEDLYPSVEAWQSDKAVLERKIAQIDDLAPGWTDSASRMVAFLNHVNDLQLLGTKLYSYASHRSNMDLGNQQFQTMKGDIRNLFVNMGTQLAFVDPDVLKLGGEAFAQYLKQEKGLTPYRFSVEKILRMKDHVLPEAQEKIVTQTGLFSGAASRAANMLDNVEIPPAEITISNGQKVKLNYATYARLRASGNAEDRHLAMRTYWDNQRGFQNTLAVLLDAGIKKDLFHARVYGYRDCLESRLYRENIDPQVYHNLIHTVRENLGSLHRYLRLKQELLGLKEFLYEDIYASAVPTVDRLYTFEEAREIILEMMRSLGPAYLEGLHQAFDERWIDIYPNKGKESGAYSGGVYGVHPYVKMNYDGSYSTLSTLAHELGHALHSYFSNQNQHFADSHYPTFLAEIASTFNENLLMHHLLRREKDDLFKLFILDGYLTRIRSTLHRQTLFAEFELAMHNRVEQGQTLTPDWLNDTYLALTRHYYGHDQGVMTVGDFIRNEWSGIPHFYLNYYVFQYSTGIIASMALSDMVLTGGKAEADRYLDFLKAGGSRFPLDTLKIAGLDMTDPAPIKAALDRFDRLVGEMEEIVARLKRAGKL